MVAPVKHAGGMREDPRKRHMKANFAQKERAYKEMGRPRGGLGGPKRRGNKWDALKVLGGTLMDLDGTMGYGHMDRAAQGIQQRNAMMAEQAERERRQAMLTKYTDGLTPEQAQLAQLAPDQFLDAQVERAFAQPDPNEYGFMNVDGVGYRYDKRGGTMTAMTERHKKPPAPGMVRGPGGNWVYDANYLAGQERIRAAGRDSISFSASGEAPLYKPLEQYAPNQFIPRNHPLLEGEKIEPGMRFVGTGDPENPVAAVPITGSERERLDTESEQSKRAMDMTLQGMFGGFQKLDQNNEIRNPDRGIWANIVAYGKASAAGQEVGRMTGSDAQSIRDTIKGNAPTIVRAIMADPNISARAFDSDAELRFFLSGIADGTKDYWTNMALLDVLDQQFGSGTLIETAFSDTPEAIERIRGGNGQLFQQQVMGGLMGVMYDQNKGFDGWEAKQLKGYESPQQLAPPPNLPAEVLEVWEYLTPDQQALYTGG